MCGDKETDPKGKKGFGGIKSMVSNSAKIDHHPRNDTNEQVSDGSEHLASDANETAILKAHLDAVRTAAEAARAGGDDTAATAMPLTGKPITDARLAAVTMLAGLPFLLGVAMHEMDIGLTEAVERGAACGERVARALAERHKTQHVAVFTHRFASEMRADMKGHPGPAFDAALGSFLQTWSQLRPC